MTQKVGDQIGSWYIFKMQTFYPAKMCGFPIGTNLTVHSKMIASEMPTFLLQLSHLLSTKLFMIYGFCIYNVCTLCVQCTIDRWYGWIMNFAWWRTFICHTPKYNSPESKMYKRIDRHFPTRNIRRCVNFSTNDSGMFASSFSKPEQFYRLIKMDVYYICIQNRTFIIAASFHRGFFSRFLPFQILISWFTFLIIPKKWNIKNQKRT